MGEKEFKVHAESTSTLITRWMNENNINKDDIVALLYNEQYILVYYG